MPDDRDLLDRQIMPLSTHSIYLVPELIELVLTAQCPIGKCRGQQTAMNTA
jgi:hypothetical protein